MRLSYALTTALVAVALAASAAQAMPDIGPGTSAAAVSATVHDPSGAMKQLPGPPEWPVNPRPIAPVPAEPAESVADDGLPLETIALALAGAALVLAVAGTLAGRRRRSHRPRVA